MKLDAKSPLRQQMSAFMRLAQIQIAGASVLREDAVEAMRLVSEMVWPEDALTAANTFIRGNVAVFKAFKIVLVHCGVAAQSHSPDWTHSPTQLNILKYEVLANLYG